MEYKALSRFAYLLAGLVIGIWFLFQVIDVILLLFFAIVIAIVLNAPVTWLQKKKMGRTAASLLVFLGFIGLFALIGWMVVPKIVTQVKLLLTSLPDYVGRLNERVAGWIGEPAPSGGKSSSIAPFTDQLPPLIKGIGEYSLSIFNGLLMIIFFFCIVIYVLINPKPLLKSYLVVFPEAKREKAAEAFAYASTMTIGWMWSNIAAGALRATIVWFFLYFMGIPGVWVWAGVTFFAELIPKLGFYIMSVPPILIAFSISPTKALYVTGFLLVLDEIIGDFILPRIRSKTMKIHPVPILVMLLAMTAAFGVMGAFIATPLAAFIKAYYETFYEKKLPEKETDKNVEKMLFRS